MVTKKKKGFTLIELLIVIAIIAILAGIIFASTGGARQKARDSQRVANVKEIHDALLMYEGDNPGTYPGALSGLVPKYLPVLPKDPVDGDDYHYGTGTSQGGIPGFIVGADLERSLTDDPKGPLSQDIDATTYTIDCDDADDCVAANPKDNRYCYCTGIP